MKYTELERQIMEEKDIFAKGELIMKITENDEVGSNLARKVIKRDIQSLIEKIQGIFQRSEANCNESSTDIRTLIDWLEYIED